MAIDVVSDAELRKMEASLRKVGQSPGRAGRAWAAVVDRPRRDQDIAFHGLTRPQRLP